MNKRTKIAALASKRFLHHKHGFKDVISDAEVNISQIANILHSSELLSLDDAMEYYKNHHNYNTEIKSLCGVWSGVSVYAHGNPDRIIKGESGVFHINEWVDEGVKPVEAQDVTPFLEWIQASLNNDERKVDYLLSVLSWKLNNLMVKGSIALYLYGAQGSGKGLLKTLITNMVGGCDVMYVSDVKNMLDVDAWKKPFMIGDEVKIEMGGVYNKLKSRITESEVYEDRKYERMTKHATPALAIMLSNYAPSFIEEGDRRFFVSEFHNGMDNTTDEHAEYFKGLAGWLNKPANQAAVKGYLLDYKSVFGFDCYQSPLVTDEKIKHIRKSKGKDALEDFLYENSDLYVFEKKKLLEALKLDETAHYYALVELFDEELVNFKSRKRVRVLIRKGFRVSGGSGSKSSIVNSEGNFVAYTEDQVNKALVNRENEIYG